MDSGGIYEAIGVPEYWVVDLTAGRVLVHRRDADTTYQVEETTGGMLATPVAPGLAVPVTELLAEDSATI